MIATAPAKIDQAVRMASRATPDTLMHHLTQGRFKRPRHVRFIGRKLAEVAEGNRRVILAVSVRHGKSWLGSLALPVWYLDWFPERSVGLATYQANFAALWGRRVRNTINLHASDLRVRIADDSSAAHSWNTSAGGGLHTAGVGGEFTGRGFNLIVIDDPIKNAEEANSEVYRKKVWEWWQQTVYTRLEPGGSVVVIMARWHEDDLTGRLIEDFTKGDGEPWEVISLPAIAEKDDALGREPGEALWPARYNVDDLARIKRAVGSRAWSALYQQRPTPASGGMFKRQWFGQWVDAGDHYELCRSGETRRVLKSECWRMAVADTAQTEKTTSDYSVRGVVDVTPTGDMILLHRWRDQVDVPDVEAELRRTLTDWRPAVLAIEDKAAGQGTVQRFQREGLPVIGLKAPTDKVSRATTAAVYAENGRIFLPAGADWTDSFLDELTRFPLGANDDQVDMLSHGANLVANRDLYRPVLTEFSHRHLHPLDLTPRDWPCWVYLRIVGPTAAALLLTVSDKDRLHVAGECYTDGGVLGLATAMKDVLREHGRTWGDLRGVYADPDEAWAKRSNQEAPAEALRKLGIRVSPWAKVDKRGWQARIDATRTAFEADQLLLNERCRRLAGELRLWRHKANGEGYDGTDLGVRCLMAWVASKPKRSAPTLEPMHNPAMSEVFGDG